MGDFVHLKENCPEGYDLAGDMPLLDYIKKYDLDEVYNKFFKKRTVEDIEIGDIEWNNERGDR